MNQETSARAPIKVMFLTVGLDIGGVEVQLREVTSRLDRSKFQVVVCSLKSYGVIAQELSDLHVPVVSLGGAGKYDLRVWIRLCRLLSRERPDILHASLFIGNILARLAGRMLGIPMIISSYEDAPVREKLFETMLDRFTQRWTQVVVCRSNAIKDLLHSRVRHSESKYIIIPNGVDCKLFREAQGLSPSTLGLREGLPVVGTICRVEEPTKGLSGLFDAMAQIHKRNGCSPFQLLIVGEGSALKRMKELCRRYGLDSVVRFTGARRDVQNILPLLDVFVLPSLSEGFGIAIAEAMAAGKPVVATMVGGIPELVASEQYGVLVPPGDPIALGRAILEVLSNPQRAKEMGSHGQWFVNEHYSIESVVRKHEQLYEMCVARA